MKRYLAMAMAGALAIMPVCMAEERGDLIIDRDNDGVEDIGYIVAAPEDFVGNWQDEVTQRAVMEVTLEDDMVHFVVSWANSDDSTTEWVFDGTPADDGVIDYNNGQMCIYTGSADDYEVIADNIEGCVAIDTDGAIYWVDSECEASNTMRFVKVSD